MTCQQAKDIVSHCPSCQQVNSTPTLPEGVNPQGLFPNDIWQTDEFNKALKIFGIDNSERELTFEDKAINIDDYYVTYTVK